MRLIKFLPLYVCLIIMVSFLYPGCKQQEKPKNAPGTEKTTVESEEQVPADTTGDITEMRKQAGMDTSYSYLERSKSEFEKRLESLVFLIEKKEESLLKREQRVLDREEMLMAKATTLDERAEDLRRLQILSWIVLGLGVIGIIFGFVVASRKGNRSSERPSAPAPTPTTKKEPELKNKKDEYIKKAEAQLKEWTSRMGKLKEKAEAAKGNMKKEYQAQIDTLETRKVAAEKKLQELKKAGATEWEKLKSDVEKAVTDAKKAFDDAVAKIK